MSPARRNRREAAAGEERSFGEKTAGAALCPGRLGEPSLWGACLVSNIDSIQKKIIGFEAKKLQP